MKIIYKLMLLSLIACISITGYSQTNPLLVHSNEPIRFDKITAAVIKQAVKDLEATSDMRVKKIVSIPASGKTTANTLMAFDELLYDLGDLAQKLSVIASTYQNDSSRDAANEEAGNLGNYSNDLFLNEGLYNAMKTYSTSAMAKGLRPNQKKFIRETIIAFEKNGMKLDAPGRKELQALNEKLINLGIEFDRNIAEYKDSVKFTEADLAGVAENTKKPWKRSDGNYIVYVNGPNAIEVTSNATNSETRHTMLLHYNNRAYPKNIKTLDSLFFYRNVFAKKLGFRSYAEYATVDKMSGSPAKVWSFEYDLKNKLAPNVTKELKELSALKQQYEPGADTQLKEWDMAYYRKKLLDTKYKVNTDEVKEYFEMNNTLKGMFRVYEKLFNLRIEERKDVPVWYEKVKSYVMYKDGKKIGYFYLDLFPRPNKYTHFACFSMSNYRMSGGQEILPVSTLICNFPEGNASEPSLLYHSDVVTLFHEFGHLVHSMLGRSDIATQGPFAVKGDFTEAPSQFLENWVWEYESLKLLAKHYKTGAVLPKALFDKMKASQYAGVASQYIRQVYFGMLDFTYEDKYDSIKGMDIVQVSKDLGAMTQLPFTEGTHFITAFGHLNGYAANYYGYLWSKVFAEDMFSVFKRKGVMDPKTGLRYRKEILEKASTKEEMDMLRAFLGREPNSDAFLKALGLK
jgi:thimet oligopeptidase